MNDQSNKDTQHELGALPEDIAPRADLWPAIAAAIQADKDTHAAPLRRRNWTIPVAAAAAVTFLVLGFWLGRTPIDGTRSVELATTDASDSSALIAASMGPDYASMRAELVKRATPALAQLSDEERAQVEASLQDIQNAVQDIETALGDDPTNALLQALLVQSAQEEMQVLTTLESLAVTGEEMTL